MMKSIFKQRGVTLIELMIGMVVGLIVVGGVGTVYVATVKSSAETLRSSRLNQEMGSLMQIMADDIRRAGFWGEASIDNAKDNPFNIEDQTELGVRSSANAEVVFTGDVNDGRGSGSCIVYSYDLNIDNDVDTTDTDGNELFGFKLDGDEVKMRTGCSAGGCTAALADSCTAGTWSSVTDPNSIIVETLTFDLGQSKCLNVTDDNNCFTVAPGTDDVTIEVREVEITLTARLTSDSLVKSTMSQTVRVRNDMIRVN